MNVATVLSPNRSAIGPQKNPTVRQQPGGFTLIELLLVMAVIALLISILLPALSSVRESGRAVKCASNLRQFGIALAMYLKDSDWIMPPMRPAKNPDGTSPTVDVGNGKKVRPRMPAPLVAYLREFAFDAPSTTDERQDYTAPFMACPSVPKWIDERNYAYGFNYQFLGNTRVRVSAATSFINYPVHESSIGKATRTIFMADSMGTAAAFPRTSRTSYEPKGTTVTALGNHAYALDPPYIPSHMTDKTYVSSDPERNGNRSAMDPRHNGRANALFCDGHVQAMTLAEAGYEVLEDGTVTHGHKSGEGDDVVLTGDNRYFSGDFTNKAPPLAD